MIDPSLPKTSSEILSYSAQNQPNVAKFIKKGSTVEKDNDPNTLQKKTQTLLKIKKCNILHLEIGSADCCS